MDMGNIEYNWQSNSIELYQINVVMERIRYCLNGLIAINYYSLLTNKYL